MQILQTKDYKQFKLIEGNRPINKTNKRQLTHSIARNNLLEVNPIIVNENMEIIDGQHRFQIAKENNWSIYYIQASGTGIKDVHDLNNVSRKWGSYDYVDSWARLGRSSYKKMLDFAADNRLYIGTCFYFIFGGVGGLVYTKIRNGFLELTDEDFEKAQEKLDYFNKLITYFEGTIPRRQHLVAAIFKLFEKGYQDKLIEELDKREIRLPHEAYTSAYLRVFEGILNYKKSANIIRLF